MRVHPNCMIGRLVCTCGNVGAEAVWHITPCEIKLVHLENLAARGER
ncbi:hypothetical protein [Nocardioides terrigena]|nr:hypothetical protein [Nocardioides terrigena]